MTRGGNSSATRENGYKVNKPNSGKRNVTDASIVCEVCHLTVHSKDKCFYVHGYPSWHRLFGKPKPKPKNRNHTKSAQAYNVHGNVASEILIKIC